MEPKSAMEMAIAVVAAHVGNNTVGADAVPDLIKSVYQTIAGLPASMPTVERGRNPAIDVSGSISDQALTCLECGAAVKLLRRHLLTEHQMSPDINRLRWNLSASYPMVPPGYSARRSEIAQDMMLGRKTGRGRGRAQRGQQA